MCAGETLDIASHLHQKPKRKQNPKLLFFLKEENSCKYADPHFLH